VTDKLSANIEAPQKDNRIKRFNAKAQAKQVWQRRKDAKQEKKGKKEKRTRRASPLQWRFDEFRSKAIKDGRGNNFPPAVLYPAVGEGV
jgi:hypothetical protein